MCYRVVRNPVVRLGWKTFGRLMQVLFVRRSLKRMKRLFDAELIVGGHAAGVPLMRDRVTVHPDAGSGAA